MNDFASLTGQAARTLAAKGLRVLPCWWPTDEGRRCACGKASCADIGKHPLGSAVPHGCLDATTDARQIESWWTRWPSANVAIATGAASGVFVVDIDPRHGGHVSFEALEERHAPLPYSVRVKTGSGGGHIYFAHPGGDVRIANSSRRLGAGIDVRGDGGFVLAPPSLHASGQRYCFLDADSSVLEPAPEWLINLLSRYDAGRPAEGETGPSLPDELGEEVLLRLLREAQRRILAGESRHNTILWAFGQARDNRISQAVCAGSAEALLSLCHRPGDREVTAREVTKLLEWAWSRAPRDPSPEVAEILAAAGGAR